MKQIAIFTLPKDIESANEFLATCPPESISYWENNMIVYYDNEIYPIGYQINELRSLILSNMKAKMTNRIAEKITRVEVTALRPQLEEAQKDHDVAYAILEAIEDKKLPEYSTAKANLEAIGKKCKKIEETLQNEEKELIGLDDALTNYETKNAILEETIKSLTVEKPSEE
jgi:hypothetical protein